MQDRYMMHISFPVTKKLSGPATSMKFLQAKNVLVEGRPAAIKAAEEIGKFSESGFESARDFLEGSQVYGGRVMLLGETAGHAAIIYPL